MLMQESRKGDTMTNDNNITAPADNSPEEATSEKLTAKTETEMKSEEFVTLLNEGQDGTPWKQDTNNINNGFPILSWQEE